MTIEITELAKGIDRVQVRIPGVTFELNRDDQHIALETLARGLGYTLVDEQERRGLQELVAEADGEQSGNAADQAVLWRALARALATAVSEAMRFENDREV